MCIYVCILIGTLTVCIESTEGLMGALNLSCSFFSTAELWGLRVGELCLCECVFHLWGELGPHPESFLSLLTEPWKFS